MRLEWKPIETAPKDGTKVMVLEYDDVHSARFVYHPAFGNAWVCRADGGVLVLEPTHWQPLPPPPGKEGV